MIKITVLTVGKVKANYLTEGIALYTKRLAPYAHVKYIEVVDEKAPDSLSIKQVEQIKDKEGQKLLAKIDEGAQVVTLEIEGKAVDSLTFSTQLDKWMTQGVYHIYFIIGGSNGLSDAVKKRSNYALSFSKMTFPHQMMKLILLEQIYRAFKIQKNETYHK